MYEIERQPSKHRVLIKFDSYADHDRIKFIVDLQEAALSVRSADRHFDMLADFTESIVMPQPIAKDSITLSDWLVQNGLRKSANVMTSITQQMQVQRVTERNEKFGYFETRTAAERWLDS